MSLPGDMNDDLKRFIDNVIVPALVTRLLHDLPSLVWTARLVRYQLAWTARTL